MVKDWNKIKAFVIFEAKCAKCGNDTQVNFRPDGRRPIYCKDCYRKYKKT
ncbi:MAG TPA: CxxC-x17-CxxC domain-containing protein [Nitrososphaeraceae archaeon]